MTASLTTSSARPAVPPLPLGQVMPWAALAMLLFLVAGYFVGAEQGAVSLISGTQVHEFVHDARHLQGFPCH